MKTYRGYASVVGQHETTNTVIGRHVRRLLGQGHLYTRRAPWNESRQATLTNSEKRFVNLFSPVSQCTNHHRTES